MVPWEAHNEAELCQFISIFMLLLLSKHIKRNNFGVYTGDGLAILKKPVVQKKTLEKVSKTSSLSA